MIVNYVTGLSIGLTIGRKLYSLFNNEQSAAQLQSGFILLHSLPGRRRYKNSLLIGNQALSDAWQSQMLRLPKVSRVTMNTVLGTFLIEYICPESDIERLLACLNGTEDTAELGEAEAEYSRMPLGRVGMKIRKVFAGLNDWLRKTTGHEWDLATLCAVIFSIIGLNKIITLRQVPSGPQLLWWAFGMLKGRVGLC